MNPSLDLSAGQPSETGSPQARLSDCVSDDLAAWFRTVDMSQMGVIDRMVFDINRRAILEKSRSKPDLTAKKVKTGTEEVFHRLVEDTSKRLESKSSTNEVQPVQRPKTPKAGDDQNSVYGRLQQDAKARRESSVTRMRIKEAEERQQLKEMQQTRSRHTTTVSTDLIERLMTDAQKRKRTAEEAAREKERREREEAKRMAEMHHPKRKPDPQIRSRLITQTRRPQILQVETHPPPEPILKTSPTVLKRPVAIPQGFVKMTSLRKAGRPPEGSQRDGGVEKQRSRRQEMAPMDSPSPVRTERDVEEPVWVQVASEKAGFHPSWRPASATVASKTPLKSKEDLISRVMRKAVGVNMS